jgi:glycosidase
MSKSWLNEGTVIYQVFVDRFSTGVLERDLKLANKTSNNWMSGNLKGIINRLNHIEKFSNTIYISPIFLSSNYHGYSVENHFKIDPHFGSAKDLKKLVDECHKRNIKVILDFVPNHVSFKNPIFLDAQRNRSSKYFNWFIFKKWPKEYLCFLDVKELPKLNLENEEAANYIISAAKYWVLKFDIDGYRLDHSIGPPLRFWRKFKKEMKKLKKDFVLIGEHGNALGWYFDACFKKDHIETLWFIRDLPNNVRRKIESLIDKSDLFSIIELNDILMKYTQDIFDGCIDFTFMDLSYAIASNKLTMKEFEILLEKHYKKFSKGFNLITSLSNHDRGRFLSYFGKKKLIDFSILQFSISQPTLIYYGEEIGLKGKGTFEKAREFMSWNEKRWNKDIFMHYRRLFIKKLSN